MQIGFTYSLKKCLLGLVVLTCFIGAFNVGIFEIVHTFTHHFKGGHTYLSHHSHHLHGKDSNHTHVILDATKAIFDEISDSPDLQNKKQKFSFDKSPLVCVLPYSQTTPSALKIKSVPVYNLQILLVAFLEIFLPPPDFTP